MPPACSTQDLGQSCDRFTKILAFVAVSLLLVFRHQLLTEKTSEGVRIFLNKVWHHSCAVVATGEIVSGWKNIWDGHVAIN